MFPALPRSVTPKATGILIGALVSICAPYAGAVQVDAAFLDKQIAAKADAVGVKLSGRCEDGEFQRRLWLDLVGTIPSAEEARRFLADASPQKRAALAERLLADPRFPARMAEALHLQLMERGGEDEQWLVYLTNSMKANKPWDVLVREMVAPDFKDESKRAAGYFMTRRLDKVGSQTTDYPGLTRDVGRMFMGLDLQCCQCHNHLTVNDYKQIDFNGLFTVFQNLKLNEPAGEYKIKWLSEGLMEAKFEFTSVLSGVKGSTGPRVPLGQEIDIPSLPEAERWLVAPDKKTKLGGVPKFSALQNLAEKLTSKENPQFARNIVNRLWWQFMGRGLVEPLDLSHSGNPASHPELLEQLASTMVERQFDLRWMVREMVLSEAYQRSGKKSAAKQDVADELFALALERRISAEQFLRAFLTAAGEFERVLEKKGWDEFKEPPLDPKKVQTSFRNAFANAPKEPELKVDPSLRGALFLRNNSTILWALQPRPGNLLDRLLSMEKSEAIAAELYLSFFSRLPDKDEAEEVGSMLSASKDRPKTLSKIAWAMAASMEFYTNH